MHRDNNYDLEATRRKLPTLVAGVTGIEDICAASIVTRTVKWEWPGRIPKGKVTMADGDPGQGKSAVTMDIAARKSAGRAFPDGAPCEAGNVLICNVEDDAADTIVPRLKAHGADLSRVFLFSEVPDGSGGRRLLELPRDLEPLKAKVIERRIELLILDPVLTMLGGDANKDQDARKALTPIKHMAEETEVAVILVRHLNKSVGLKAIQRGGGNMGLIGVARAGMFFGDHPEDDGLHVMAVHKSNLAEKPPSLGYRIVTSAVHDTARVEWTGAVDLDANALAANNGGQDKTVLDEAKEFLRDELGDGPIFARQVLKDARDAGVADITLRRAKTSLGVKSTRHGTEGWTWELPTRKDDPPRDHDFSKDNLERLEHVEHLGGIRERREENTPLIGEGDHDDHDAQPYQGTKQDRLQRPDSLRKDFASPLPRQSEQQGSEEKGGHGGAPGPVKPSLADGGSVSGFRHGGNDVVGQASDEDVEPSGGSREKRLTTEEAERVKRLFGQGMSHSFARAEVLRDDDGMRF